MSGLLKKPADLHENPPVNPILTSSPSPCPLPANKMIGFVRPALAILVAFAADGFQFVIPPLWWLADGFAFIALLFVFGLRWQIFLSLLVEVIPGIALFPTWSIAVVAMLATQNSHKSNGP